MYKLLVTELAHQDLGNIVSYIAVKLANSKAAGEFLDEVDKCYSFFKNSPMMYEKCQDKRLEKEGYRKALIKNYVLIYRIDEKCQTVNIMRFFHGEQDYIRLI